MPTRRSYIRSLAREALAKGGPHSPPVPVDDIAEAYGIRVVYQDLKGNLSGFLHRAPAGALIGVNTHHPKVRQRFTVAHELGHYLLFDTFPVHVDHSFEVKRRGELASKGTNREEIDANMFAAELLMPGDLIEKDLEHGEVIDFVDETSLRRMAKQYQVSIQAMTIRLGDLGHL